MSPEAAQLLSDVRMLFLSAATSGDLWLFHHGDRDEAHDELARLGMIMRVLGTQRGFAWRLTDAGLQGVREQTSTNIIGAALAAGD